VVDSLALLAKRALVVEEEQRAAAGDGQQHADQDDVAQGFHLRKWTTPRVSEHGSGRDQPDITLGTIDTKTQCVWNTKQDLLKSGDRPTRIDHVHCLAVTTFDPMQCKTAGLGGMRQPSSAPSIGCPTGTCWVVLLGGHTMFEVEIHMLALCAATTTRRCVRIKRRS